MIDMNELLSMLENPTRRRILSALTMEPHYPLQLSKELGVSQPAIVKHLNLLEERGMVTKYQEESRKGPKKTLYTPNSEFTLVLDMRNGMFNTRLVFPSEAKTDPEKEEIGGLDEVRKTIFEMDEELTELERIRCDIIGRRESMIHMMLDSIPKDSIGYRHRNLLYRMLNDPGKDIDSLSMDLSLNTDQAKKMLDDIKHTIRKTEEEE